MTIADTLNLLSAFVALNEQSKRLNAKSKWNLAMNLTRCREVAKAFEEQRLEIFRRHAEGSTEIKPEDTEFEAYKAEVEALLKVDTDAKILHFEFADIVRDDLEISSELIAQLESVLEGKPE